MVEGPIFVPSFPLHPHVYNIERERDEMNKIIQWFLCKQVRLVCNTLSFR